MSIEQIEQLINKNHPDEKVEIIKDLKYDRFLVLSFNFYSNLYSCCITKKGIVYLFSSGTYQEMQRLFEMRYRNFYNKIMR